MLIRHKNVLFGLLVAILLSLGAAAHADPQLELERFEGRVDSFDLAKNRLIVNDFGFTLSNDTQVKRANGNAATLLSLTPGTPVELQFEIIRHSAYKATHLVHIITVQR